MPITNLDHVVIAVNDVEAAAKTWQENFGLPLERSGANESLGINQAILPIGSAFIELISPLSDSGPVADALKNKGEGLYLLSLAVDDLDATLAELRERGTRVLLDADDMPWGERVAYVTDPDGNPVALAAPVATS